MPTSIKPKRLNHMNILLEDIGQTKHFFQQQLDAQCVIDIPKAEYHACLMASGGVLFEIFTPKVYLFNARYGPHYLGVEYQANMDDVVNAVSERKMRIVRESRYEKDLAGNPGYALHTHPQDGFGVSYEFYHDDFHQWHWPDLNGKIQSKEDWSNHLSGIQGQYGYTHAVHDINAAQEFLMSFLSAKPIYEAHRPYLNANAVGLRVADVVVELQTPNGPGVLADHLHRYGDGIRSTIFNVKTLEQARSYFKHRGLQAQPGYADELFSLKEQDSLGVLFEFKQCES